MDEKNIFILYKMNYFTFTNGFASKYLTHALISMIKTIAILISYKFLLLNLIERVLFVSNSKIEKIADVIFIRNLNFKKFMYIFFLQGF